MEKNFEQNITLVLEDLLRYTACSKSILLVGSASTRLARIIRNTGFEVTVLQNTGYLFSEDLNQSFFDLMIFTVNLDDVDYKPRNELFTQVSQLTNEIIIPIPALDYRKIDGRETLPPATIPSELAKIGFFRDLNFNVYIQDVALAYFRRSDLAPELLVGSYEQKLWLTERYDYLNLQEAQSQRQIMSEIASQLEARLNAKTPRKRIRHFFFPPGSKRESFYYLVRRGGFYIQQHGFRAFLQRFWDFLRSKLIRLKPKSSSQITTFDLDLSPWISPPIIKSHAAVDVIVCVHNALNDVKTCLNSVINYSSQPYKLIIVDDGSHEETKLFLDIFAAQSPDIELHRNPQAQGYTYAANIGMRKSTGDYVILLNSDTIVTPGWLDRMVTCAESNEKIGVVGPLSNTASWQSVPEILIDDDWARNPLPGGINVDEFGRALSNYSGRIFPEMPLLNGFCLLIKKKLLNEIGLFDEENFGRGYGEEDDFNLRARQAGWKLALADDVYIYHAQSKSYSNENRKQLAARSGQILIQKHGNDIIQQGVRYCRYDRVLQGIRFQSAFLPDKIDLIHQGHRKHNGRKILFLLPVTLPGGGANVIFNEAKAMQKMGVQVDFYNLTEFRPYFEKAYPNLPFIVRYGDRDELPLIAIEYDAVIASVNHSVQWLSGVQQHFGYPKFGYYIQGFEPLIFNQESQAYRVAMDSYTLFPNLIRFCKTGWTKDQIKKNCNVETELVGISLDTELFRPRPRQLLEGRIRITAMVRPETPYREPEKTMLLLQKAWERYGDRVEILIFGTTFEDPKFLELPHNFEFQLAGILHPSQVAILLNEADIFVDYSSHQAMGLTALEAMNCGCAVILPEEGGAVEYAVNEKNALIVDTTEFTNVWQALQILVEKDEFRLSIQQQAMKDAGRFYPEKPAMNILDTLFEEK